MNDGRNAVNKLSDSLPTRMSHTSRDDVNHTPKPDGGRIPWLNTDYRMLMRHIELNFIKPLSQ